MGANLKGLDSTTLPQNLNAAPTGYHSGARITQQNAVCLLIVDDMQDKGIIQLMPISSVIYLSETSDS